MLKNKTKLKIASFLVTFFAVLGIGGIYKSAQALDMNAYINDKQDGIVEVHAQSEDYKALCKQQREEAYKNWQEGKITTEEFDAIIEKIGTREHIIESLDEKDSAAYQEYEVDKKEKATEILVAGGVMMGVGAAGYFASSITKEIKEEEWEANPECSY